jgi:CRP-like cAMP-binding protein
MNAHDLLGQHLAKYNLLTDEEIHRFAREFQEVNIRKRQYIVQPGFVARHRNFVAKGAFRSFVVGDQGSDHTISFAIEDWWITDYNSYVFQQPATLFVMALEDSVILQVDYESEQKLKRENHACETIFRIMAERGLAFYQRRLIDNLTLSAEERYEHFLYKYPQIVQRMPQYALASYLNMTTEFLSKIRNQKASRKR